MSSSETLTSTVRPPALTGNSLTPSRSNVSSSSISHRIVRQRHLVRHLQPRYLSVDALEVRTNHRQQPAPCLCRAATHANDHPLFRHVCLTSARQSSHCKTTPERQRRVPLIKMRDRTINCGNNLPAKCGSDTRSSSTPSARTRPANPAPACRAVPARDSILPVVGKSEAEAEAAHQFQDEPMLLARLILRRQPSLQVAHTHHSLVLRESCESAHMQ